MKIEWSNFILLTGRSKLVYDIVAGSLLGGAVEIGYGLTQEIGQCVIVFVPENNCQCLLGIIPKIISVFGMLTCGVIILVLSRRADKVQAKIDSAEKDIDIRYKKSSIPEREEVRKEVVQTIKRKQIYLFLTLIVILIMCCLCTLAMVVLGGIKSI